MRDEDEITKPGTPDALHSWREVRSELRDVILRLSHICDAIDALERDVRSARAESKLAFDRAQEALKVARFTDKRVDALVARVQAAEGRAR